MTLDRLPLTVIGGFLGAGKTTLLNHWLRHAGVAGQRLAVLVNDFGALNIDAELIASSAGDTFTLTNGCVCCQIGDDLSQALMRVLESSTRFDAVVIEASGVADPWKVAQMGRADPGLSLDGVVVLVDASVALQQSRDVLLADTLERQLKAADLVVVNKMDLATAVDRIALREWVATLAGVVPLIETAHAEVPLQMLSSLALPTAGAATPPHAHAHTPASNSHDASCEHAAADHGHVFDSWSCRPQRVFAETELRGWLRASPGGLLRLKGVLRTGPAAWSEIQFAGRHGTLRAAPPPADGAAVVAIGLRGQLPVAALDATFRAAERI